MLRRLFGHTADGHGEATCVYWFFGFFGKATSLFWTDLRGPQREPGPYLLLLTCSRSAWRKSRLRAGGHMIADWKQRPTGGFLCVLLVIHGPRLLCFLLVLEVLSPSELWSTLVFLPDGVFSPNQFFSVFPPQAVLCSGVLL